VELKVYFIPFSLIIPAVASEFGDDALLLLLQVGVQDPMNLFAALPVG
jgi:hypothetical protein